MKLLKKLILLMVLAFVLTSCGEKNADNSQGSDNDNNVEETTAGANNQSSEESGWEIEVEESQRNKKLEDISTVLGYSEVDVKEFSKEASEGKEFFLIKMKLSKKSGSEKIVWENLILKDGNGNTFSRIEDAFLSELNMKRLPGTDLNFGSNEGWIAFEIDETSTDLVLEYQFESGTFSYNFK